MSDCIRCYRTTEPLERFDTPDLEIGSYLETPDGIICRHCLDQVSALLAVRAVQIARGEEEHLISPDDIANA